MPVFFGTFVCWTTFEMARDVVYQLVPNLIHTYLRHNKLTIYIHTPYNNIYNYKYVCIVAAQRVPFSQL